MKLTHLAIAASLLTGTVAAFAVEATQWNPPAGTLTRAEVKSELARATARGELQDRGEAYAGYTSPAPQSTMARADVKAELATARANGEMNGRNDAYDGTVQPRSQARGGAFAFGKRHGESQPATGHQ